MVVPGHFWGLQSIPLELLVCGLGSIPIFPIGRPNRRGDLPPGFGKDSLTVRLNGRKSGSLPDHINTLFDVLVASLLLIVRPGAPFVASLFLVSFSAGSEFCWSQRRDEPPGAADEDGG